MAAHQPWRPESLRQRRYNVTRASNCVRDSIGYLLKPLPADTVFYRDGLPSWWSFWSDSLKDRVRELVRHARQPRPHAGHGDGHGADLRGAPAAGPALHL